MNQQKRNKALLPRRIIVSPKRRRRLCMALVLAIAQPNTSSHGITDDYTPVLQRVDQRTVLMHSAPVRCVRPPFNLAHVCTAVQFCLYVSLCLPACCLSVSVCYFCLPACLTSCLSVCLSVSQSVSHSVSQSLSLCVCLSDVCLTACLSPHPCLFPYITEALHSSQARSIIYNALSIIIGMNWFGVISSFKANVNAVYSLPWSIGFFQ